MRLLLFIALSASAAQAETVADSNWRKPKFLHDSEIKKCGTTDASGESEDNATCVINGREVTLAVTGDYVLSPCSEHSRDFALDIPEAECIDGNSVSSVGDFHHVEYNK